MIIARRLAKACESRMPLSLIKKLYETYKEEITNHQLLRAAYGGITRGVSCEVIEYLFNQLSISFDVETQIAIILRAYQFKEYLPLSHKLLRTMDKDILRNRRIFWKIYNGSKIIDEYINK